MKQKLKTLNNLQNLIIKIISIFVISFIIISSSNVLTYAQTTPVLVIDQTKIKPLLTSEYAQKANDKINVVFFFKDNNISIPNLVTEISHAIGLDGVVADPARNYASDIGLFEIEPYKSNKDKFNFWYYDSYITEIQSKELNPMVDASKEIATFGMDNVSPIFAREEETLNESSLGAFATVQFDQNDPRRDIVTYSPGRVYLRFKKETITDSAGKITKLDKIGLKNLSTVGILFAHEFGHSLFGLSDEYASSYGTTYDNPNCAHSDEIAKEWWADLEGQTEDASYLEPFLEGYLKYNYTFQNGNYYSTIKGVKTLIDINSERQKMSDTYKVGYVKGKCFGLENADVIRPTLNSMMGPGTYPFSIGTISFGPVNTRLMKKVLKTFSGTAVKTSPSSNYKWTFNTNKSLDPDKMEAQTEKCILEKSTNIYNCTWKLLTTQKPEYMSNIKLVDTQTAPVFKALDTGSCKLTGELLNCSISFDKLPNKDLYRYNLALVGPSTPNQIPITIFLDKNSSYLTDQRLRYLNFETMLINDTVKDTTPPPAPTCTTSGSSPIVVTCTGVELGSTVTIPGSICVPTPADATGIVKCTETTPGSLVLPVAITTKDPAGNTTPSTTTVSVVKDTTAPVIPVTSAALCGSKSTNKTPTFSGTGEVGATVNIAMTPPAMTHTAIVDTKGMWSYTHPALSDGTYTLKISQTDLAGNVSPTAPDCIFTVDTTAPPAPTINPTPSTNTNPSPAISGNCKANALVTVKIAGQVLTTPCTPTGTYTVTPTTPLPIGTTPVTATQKDQAGNESPLASSTVPVVSTADTTPPLAPTCTPVPLISNGTVAIVITCTSVEAGATLTILGTTCVPTPADSTGIVKCTETTPGTVTSNPTAIVKDPAGNLSTIVLNYTKTSNPVITLACESASTSADFDLDGILDKDEILAPNLGDANYDGKCDYTQSNVVSIKNKLGNMITIEVISSNPEDKTPLINEAKIIPEIDNIKQDPNYDYPLGFVSFKVKNSISVKVNMLMHDNKEINTNQLFRKYNNLIPGNDTTLDYFNFPVTVSTRTINGKPTPTISYTLTDGELGDRSSKDGEIIDPIGLATPVAIITDNNPKPNPSSTTPQVIITPKPALPIAIPNSISTNTASLVRTGASQDLLMNSIFIFLILLIIKFKTTTLI